MKTMIGTDIQSHTNESAGNESAAAINVGTAERKISAVGGAALILLGLRAKSIRGLAAAGIGAALVHRAASGHCSVYQTLGISTDDGPSSKQRPASDYFEKGIHVEQSFTIAKPAQELFDYWRNFSNLPSFMTHLKSVTDLGGGKSHWIATAPAGQTVEWDAEIINEEPGKLIAWRSTGGNSIDHAGSIRFIPAPGDRGTVVKVVMDYIAPGGKIGSTLAKLFGEEPGQQIRDDLRHFKQLMEAGETATVDQSVRGGKD